MILFITNVRKWAFQDANNCIVNAKQKQPVAVKKGTAKQSRINAITEYDWQEQGLISSCGQVDGYNQYIKTIAKKKNRYQDVAKRIEFP